MRYEKEQNLRVLQLRFIGKILSGFTHEVKNHLAFIKESAGLIGDLMESKKSLSKQDLQENFAILHSIDEQIGKTSELCSYLNRFSHRMDYPMCTFSVNESLEELIVLINRFAHQKRIGLEKDFQKNIPMIYSDPSRIQLIIFFLIEEMIKKLDKNSRIVIKTGSLKDSLMVQIIPKGNVVTSVGEASLSSFEILQDVVHQLGGNLFQNDKEIKITLPLPPESALTQTN